MLVSFKLSNKFLPLINIHYSCQWLSIVSAATGTAYFPLKMILPLLFAKQMGSLCYWIEQPKQVTMKAEGKGNGLLFFFVWTPRLFLLHGIL